MTDAQRVETFIEEFLYPAIDRLEAEVGTPVDFVLFLSLVHRLASRQVPLDTLLQEVTAHYRDQIQHNRSNH